MKNMSVLVANAALSPAPAKAFKEKPEEVSVKKLGMSAQDRTCCFLPVLLIQDRWWAWDWLNKPVGVPKSQPVYMAEIIEKVLLFVQQALQIGQKHAFVKDTQAPALPRKVKEKAKDGTPFAISSSVQREGARFALPVFTREKHDDKAKKTKTIALFPISYQVAGRSGKDFTKQPETPPKAVCRKGTWWLKEQKNGKEGISSYYGTTSSKRHPQLAILDGSASFDESPTLLLSPLLATSCNTHKTHNGCSWTGPGPYWFQLHHCCGLKSRHGSTQHISKVSGKRARIVSGAVVTVGQTRPESLAKDFTRTATSSDLRLCDTLGNQQIQGLARPEQDPEALPLDLTIPVSWPQKFVLVQAIFHTE
ncbi:hypothetical protein P7K49_015048 [Saguinus oedipus]|uniref:Uncharacterized protein n=1 Tax=Saguinus oedipus TaxID=9490 RepID=A0ABQ9V9D2_SAGOE|nr:hypothetical protein P7K49_015048 [Saguinus oedipus]